MAKNRRACLTARKAIANDLKRGPSVLDRTWRA